MARKSWKSVIDKPATGPGKGREALNAQGSRANPQEALGLEDIAKSLGDTRLPKLLAERRALEQQMKKLIGGDEGTPQVDPRFPVKSFAERQDEIREWEAKRKQSQAVHPQVKEHARFSDLAQSPVETGLSASGLTQSLRNRAPASALHNLNDVTRLSGVQDRLRNDHKIVKAAKNVVSDLRGQVDKYDSDMKDVDRQLAENGVSKADRDDVQSVMKSQVSDKARSALGQADKFLNAPRRVADKIESGWSRRKRKIDGATDEVGRYARERARRLSVGLGGSGDLDKLSAENRLKAMKRRRDARREEKKDQDRRDRAAQRRKERDKSNKAYS